MSSIKKNYIYNIIYQILNIIIPIISAPYVTRVIGATGLGTYSYSYAIAQYFALFIALGVANYGNRSIAKVRDNKDELNKTFFEIYLIQFILGIVVISIYLVYCMIAQNNNIIALIQTIYLFSVILDISWLFFGLEEFKITVTRNMFIKILSMILIFICVKKSDDLIIYSIILSTSMLINQIILWFFAFKRIKIVKIKKNNIKKHIVSNLILFIPVLATNIYMLTDKIMIGLMDNMTEVGLYEYADKIKNIPMGLITALGVVMLPKITNLIQKGMKQEAKTYINKSFTISLFFSFALSFGLSAISNILIPIFFGSEFARASNILTILCISIVFTSWASVVRTQILIPNSMDKIYIKSTIIGCVINVLLNSILIKRYYASGAAIATVISEAVVCIYQTYKIKNEIELHKILKYIIIFGVSGLIMFLTVFYFNIYIANLLVTCIVKIILGALIYLTFSIIVLIAIKDEFLKVIFNKRTDIQNIKD